ncbi:dihydropteroate synthase DHPS [Pirellula staleyi DSM 6068]|uniref:Dihydropteroate synthase DHPS n=1 Tax=Pirellula staleyi (strain ATCC 27377 / DSM 6068 / ICPB 4128) TaxID=530564 RepID=D2R6K3_PIRSD|nr:DUF6513 domain-containing protein [Pirellula staleyi]ADB17303.1 dihydropteroate synthase DHPS [Pirellula staleyi DSM 6068]
MPEHFHFVTGRLAEHALRQEVQTLSAKLGFDFTIDVLPITVAALMTPAWIAKHITPVAQATRIILPGYCRGDLTPIETKVNAKVEVGPRDLRALATHFGEKPARLEDYGNYTIEILAEINHAPQFSTSEIVAKAKQLAIDGADFIDVGCEPGNTWSQVGEVVRALVDEGLRVSIDSLNPAEIAQAAQAGAQLVLSVNSSNRQAAADWGIEVVAIPDDPQSLDSLDDTIEYLATRNIPLRIDPILEPIGFGFAASLERYAAVRRKYPDAELMMGIGNITELTDVDSAGINVVLLAICEELGIRSVLTTQVINWARTSVAECAVARQLVHHAVKHRVPPKRLDTRLVMLRDARPQELTETALEQLASVIKDNNFRTYVSGGKLHLIGANLHLAERDPFLLFERLMNPGFGGEKPTRDAPKNVDPSHAFYLGYELAKAMIANQLGKEYRQDEALDWGLLTVAEESHRLRKGSASQRSQPSSDDQQSESSS